MNEELLEFGNGTNPTQKIWRTFDHRPRFGNNYVGLRNRLAILSEAYSYISFKERIGATTAFAEEILKYASVHTGEIIELLSHTDVPQDLGVEFALAPVPGEVEILLGRPKKKINPRSGREMITMDENGIQAASMIDYGTFRALRKVRVPAAYILPAPAPRGVAEKLVAHGIVITELLEGRRLDVERFILDETQRSERAFQGHHEVRLRGHRRTETITANAGSLLIRTDQPLGRLVFYLLDPESDDGLITWGFLEADDIFLMP
jgi:hypothetical protein